MINSEKFEREIISSSVIPVELTLTWIDGLKDLDYQDIFKEALKSHQIASKLWMVQTMNHLRLHGKVAIYAGWCGIAATMLHYLGENRYNSITTIDRNRRSTSAANLVCRDLPEVLIKMFDITKDHLDTDVDIAINTSSEHFSDADLAGWINSLPAEAIVILQSTNMPAPGHVCCSKSLDDLIARAKLVEVMFTGTLRMNKGHNRYMIIGRY